MPLSSISGEVFEPWKIPENWHKSDLSIIDKAYMQKVHFFSDAVCSPLTKENICSARNEWKGAEGEKKTRSELLNQFSSLIFSTK